MKRTLAVAPVLAALGAALTLGALALAGCTSGGGGPTVPALGGATSAATGSGGDRTAQVHAVAVCIRTHGAPTYQDPVIDAAGHVYSDTRSLDRLSRSALDELDRSCGALAARAGFSPTDEPPAPPALVAAGVRSAQCLRQNGMPNMHDPTSSSTYTPGHGFGLRASDLPNNGALGKADPAVQRAFSACRQLLDAEIRASELANLAKG
ncbi:hypothetical protein [Leifsonia shinshuensis]